MTQPRPNPRVPRPTDAELEILRVLWQRGPCTTMQVHEALTAGKKKTIFNTTLKMLTILLEKGLVTREDARRPHVYQAAVAESEMQKFLVSDLLQRAFGGAARKLVAALTATPLSAEERAAIRELLEASPENDHEHAD